MSVDRPRDWGIQRVNHYLIGGVSAGQSRIEISDPLELSDLDPGVTDWYSAGSAVSIEEAANTEFYLKEGLDDQVDLENQFSADLPVTRGLPPCKRVRGGQDC